MAEAAPGMNDEDGIEIATVSHLLQRVLEQSGRVRCPRSDRAWRGPAAT